MKQVITGGTRNGLTTTDGYLVPMGLSTLDNPALTVQAPIPTAGTLSGFRVRLAEAPGAGQSRTFQVYLGTTGYLSITISGTDTTGSSAASVAVSAGDLVAIAVTHSGSPANTAAYFALNFTGDTPNESILLGAGGDMSKTVTVFGSVAAENSPTTTEDDWRQIIPTAGTLKSLYWKCGDPGTAPQGYRLTLRKNGASTALTSTITADDTTGNDVAHTVTVAAGDRVTMMMEPVNTPDITRRGNWGLVFVADTDGESLLLGGSTFGLSPFVSQYNTVVSQNRAWDSVEFTDATILNGCTLKKFYVHLSNSPRGNDDADSYTFNVRIEGGATGITVPISDGGTGNMVGSDTTHSYEVTDGQRLTLQSVPFSAPAGADAYWGLVCQTTTNEAPVVDAGADQAVSLAVGADLDGSATDDGLPDPPAALTYLWTKVSGPGTVTFTDDTDPTTHVDFDALGDYVLRLTADDSELTGQDDVTITVTETAVRVTRAAVRTLSGKSAPIRVSRAVVRTLSPANTALRTTRQVVRTLSGESAPIRTSRLVVRTLSRQIPADPCDEPPAGEDLTSAVGPLLFITWGAGDAVTRPYAETYLGDDLSYYAGEKPAKLLQVSAIKRGMSGPRFDLEQGRFEVTVADTDGSIRALLAAAPTSYWTEREIGLYMVTEAGRRAGVTPWLAGYGVTEEDPVVKGLSVTFRLRDFVGSRLWARGTSGAETRIPKKTIQRTHFPGAPAAAIGLGLPIRFGVLSSAGHPAGTDVPAITGNIDFDRDAFSSGSPAAWTCGWGDELGPQAPTGVTLVENLGAGELSDDIPNDLYYAMAWSLDVNGVPGPVTPFKVADLSCEITDGAPPDSGTTNAMTCAFTKEPTADKTRVAFGWKYAGTFRATQILETAGSSVQFTRSPSWTTPLTLGNITPGALLPYGAGLAYLSVAAKMDDGETDTDVPVAFAYSPGFTRRVRLEWIPVIGAAAYPVYARTTPTPTDPFTARYEVTAPADHLDFFFTDLPGWEQITGPPVRRGLVPTLYTGQRIINGVAYHEFLIAGHACKDVLHWYFNDGTNPVEVDQGAGTDWWVPGQPSYLDVSLTPYVDFAGVAPDTSTIRCTCIYGAVGDGTGKADQVAAGSATLNVDLEGWEDLGNGGGEVVEDLHDQTVDLLNYFVVGDGTGIRPATPPMFAGTSICQVNRGTFRTVKAMRRAEVDGGLVAAWCLANKGERVTLNEALRIPQESGEFFLGLNAHWQTCAFAINHNLVTANLPVLRDRFDIQRDSLNIETKLDELENVLRYRHSYDWAAETWGSDDNLLRDEVSIAGWQMEREGDASFSCLRTLAAVALIRSRRLARTANVPRYATIEGDLKLTAYSVGDYVKLTHFEGIGANGWTERVFWVQPLLLYPHQRRLRLTMFDVHDLLP